jgi:aerobic carbon-monoxide dehydrogenase medium subunit
VKPARFVYHAPETVEDAVTILRRHDGDARVLAGGQSLIPIMNFRMAAPSAIVDLGRIPTLSYIAEDGDLIRIGAMTRQRQLEFSPLVREKLPLLHEAIGWVGHLPTRSRGTIGGSIAFADPATEIPMVLQALDGEIVAEGPEGKRTIKAADLFLAPLTTSLEPSEIVVEVRFPVMAKNVGHAVEEFARRRGDFAIVAVAAAVELEGALCRSVRLAAAGIGPTPLRLYVAERILGGSDLGVTAVEGASKAAAGDLMDVPSDRNASADFRRHLAEELTRRAVQRAVAMAKEKSTDIR